MADRLGFASDIETSKASAQNQDAIRGHRAYTAFNEASCFLKSSSLASQSLPALELP